VSIRELSLLFLMCLTWGFHFVVMKYAVGAVPPIFYATIRMALVALILSPFLVWKKGEMRYVFFGALCIGAFNYAFMFTGLKFATASAAAIAIELNVPFATILAILFLGDRPGWRRLLGITFAFAGVAVIAVGGASGANVGSKVGLGVGLVAAGAFCEACGAVLIKRTKAFQPHELLAWFSLVGSMTLGLMSFAFETGQQAAWAAADRTVLVLSIVYSALLASLFGHTTYYWLLQRLPISVVAPSVLLTTVLAVFFGVLLMGDHFGWRMLAGGLMTLFGVGLVLLRNVKKQANNDALVEPQG